MVTILVAHSSNRVIGINNTLPWHLPEDLKRFKKLTTGKTVVMGRKTFESIGKPLPNRTNIVLSCSSLAIEGCMVYNSPEAILQDFRDFVVIGGETIYKLFLPYTDVIEATIIDKEYEGDTYFPEVSEFVIKSEEVHKSDGFQYRYVTMEKQKNYHMSDEDFNNFLESIGGLENCYNSKKVVSRGYFEIENGWLGLVKELICELISRGWDRKICQCKQKYGALRFYILTGTDPIFKKISEYESISLSVCEKTGGEGTLRKDLSWVMTLCEEEYVKITRQINGGI